MHENWHEASLFGTTEGSVRYAKSCVNNCGLFNEPVLIDKLIQLMRSGYDWVANT